MILLLPLLLSGTITGWQQPTDRSIAVQADSLYVLAVSFLEGSDTTNGFHYLDSAYQLYLLQGDMKGMSNTLNEFGYFHYTLGNFNRSLYYYRQALELDRILADTVKIIGRLKNTGITYRVKGFPLLAIQQYTEALALAQKLRQPKSIASVSNSIGILYYDMEQYLEALAHYRTALEAWTSLEDTLRMTYAYNNLGQVYYATEQYDSALLYYRQAWQWKQALGEERTLTTTLYNLGNTYLALDSTAQAKTYLQEALAIAHQFDDTYNLATISHGLAELHLKTQNYTLAWRYLDTARVLLNELDARMVLLDHLRLDAWWHEAAGQYAEALVIQKQWAALRDSLFNEERLKVVEMQAEYTLQQEEQARQAAEQQTVLAQTESKRQRYYTAMAVGALFILALISRIWYRLYRRNRRISQHNAELVKEQHHRVKNNLQFIDDLLSLQSRQSQNEEDRRVMKEIQSRLQTMILIHRRLYGDQLTHIDMDDYLEELVRDVLDSYGCKARIEFALEKVALDVDRAQRVGLITNEVVSNACKYAFPDHPHPVLAVSFHKKMHHTYQLTIRDNGAGIADERLAAKQSFGIKLVHLMAKQLRGKAVYQKQNGTLFHLTF